MKIHSGKIVFWGGVGARQKTLWKTQGRIAYKWFSCSCWSIIWFSNVSTLPLKFRCLLGVGILILGMRLVKKPRSGYSGSSGQARDLIKSIMSTATPSEAEGPMLLRFEDWLGRYNWCLCFQLDWFCSGWSLFVRNVSLSMFEWWIFQTVTHDFMCVQNLPQMAWHRWDTKVFSFSWHLILMDFCLHSFVLRKNYEDLPI